MAKKKKEELKENEYHLIVPTMIPYDEVEEFLTDALGYKKCYQCENYVRSTRECEVCGSQFCDDCADEHAFEETGL